MNPPPTRAERQAACSHPERGLRSLYRRASRKDDEKQGFLPDAFRCGACGALIDRTPSGNPSRA